MRKVKSVGTRRICAARRISASIAIAAAAGLAVPAYGAQYTWNATGSSSTNANWSTPGNWTPSGPPHAAGDTATFNGTASGYDSPNLDTNESVGELLFLSAAGGWTLNDTSSSTLTLTADSDVNPPAGLNGLNPGYGLYDNQSSGTTTINANLSYAYDQTWYAAGGTVILNGTIGNGGYNMLTFAGAGIFELTANSNSTFNNAYLTVSSGTVDLTGNGSIQAFVYALNGGTLEVDDSGSIQVNNRLGNNQETDLSGGTLLIKGSSQTSVTETLGNLNLELYNSTGDTQATGSSTITITPASTGNNTTTLALGSLNRLTGGPVLFVNGVNLGNSASTTGYGIISVGAPAGTNSSAQPGTIQVGTSDPGQGVTLNAEIVPFLVGEIAASSTSAAPGASGAGGTAFGTPNTFVAYTSAGTLRPLNPLDEFSSTIAPSDNIYLQSSATASSSQGINSLVMNNTTTAPTLTISSGSTLTNNSGAFLFVSNATIAGPGTLAFGQEGIFTVNSGKTAVITAPVSGSNGFTLTSSGVVDLESNSSGFSGPVSIFNGGTLQLGASPFNGTQNAALDGFLPNATQINMSVGTTSLTIENVGNTTLPTINGTAAVEYITYTGKGATTVASENITGNVNNSYNLFYNCGPVTISGGIYAPTDNSQYLYDQTSSAITLGGNTLFDYTGRIYMEAGNPNTIGYFVTGENITLSSGATMSTAVSDLYVSDMNTENTKLPPPVVFNMNGTMTTTTAYQTSLTVTPIIYLGYTPTSGGSDYGQATLNITGTSSSTPASLISSVYAGFSGATQTVNPTTSVINVGANGSIVSNSGYVRNQLTISAGAYTYVTLNNGGYWTSVPSSGGSAKFALGLGGDAFMEVGAGTAGSYLTASDGVGTTTANGGEGLVTNSFTGTYGLIINDGGASGTNAVLNVYTGGTVTYTGSIANDSNFYIGTTSGENGVINVIGGAVTTTTANSPITLAGVKGVNGTLNINADSSGNQGVVTTSYLSAASGTTTAYINFNGGKLAYNGTANSNATQANFITTAFNNAGSGGVYSYSTGSAVSGATIDTSGSTVTIPAAIQAPTGNGITSITVSGTYTPFTAPPLVVISGGGGQDATAYATINGSGQATVIITSPGFGYTSAPTVKLEDGGILDGATAGTGGLASGTYAAPTVTATIGPDTSGGLFKVDTGTLNLSATNTYAGATVIEQGILSLTNSSTNNISKSAVIDVGDTYNDGMSSSSSSTTPAGSTVNGAALYTSNNTSGYGISNASGFVLASGQILSGFGTVLANGGSTTNGFTIGSGSTVSPGVTPALGTNLGGSASVTTTPLTGALKITTGGSNPATTILGGGGKYYWKINTNAAGGATFSGTSQDANNGYMVPNLSSNNTDTSGTNWDMLVLDSISGSTLSPSNQFTVNAVGFAGSGSSQVNFSNGTSYAWAIAHVADTSAASLQADIAAGDFVLNTSGTLTSASYNGQQYGYGLYGESDPSGGSDLVVVYSATPEPAALALLAPAAAALLLRRRRRAGASA